MDSLLINYVPNPGKQIGGSVSTDMELIYTGHTENVSEQISSHKWRPHVISRMQDLIYGMGTIRGGYLPSRGPLVHM